MTSFCRKKIISACTAVSLLFLMGHAVAKEKSVEYTVSKTVSIGAPDRWDYLHFDALSNRLYVSHGDRLSVIDAKSGKIIGTVKGMPGGSHGVAIVHAEGKGYTDDGGNANVISFDLKTLKLLKAIKALPDADGMLFDKYSGHVFVIDGDSAKVTVIDPKTDSVIASIDGKGGLEFGASDEKGKLYINGAEKSELVRIDTDTNEVDAHWLLPDCVSPHGIAIDRDAMRLFVSCKNARLDIIDAGNGKEISSLPIGHGSDAVGFDPVRHLVFSSNADGTLSIIAENSKNHYSLRQTFKTALGARTMALDPKTGRIYLATADYTVNKSAAPDDFRHRYKVKAGSAKILFIDPVSR